MLALPHSLLINVIIVEQCYDTGTHKVVVLCCATVSLSCL